MAKETLRDQYARGLTRLGWNRVKGHPSRKYWAFTKNGDAHIFLGKSGAVRSSMNSSVTASRDIGERYKRAILLAAEGADA